MKYSGQPTIDFLGGNKPKASIEFESFDQFSEAVKMVNEQITKGLDGKVEEITQRLVEEGVTIAKVEVPVKTGELRDSIHGVAIGGYGEIVAGTDHCLFVEFGTGINGAGSVAEVSAYGREASNLAKNKTGSLYDGTNGGIDASKLKWKYDYKEVGHAGHEANPFMYRTAKALDQLAVPIAKEILGL